MEYSKVMVCLANSRRPGGRCIAGREKRNGSIGPWIRPISARSSAEICDEERRYRNGADPAILDILEVPFLMPAPRRHQTENHVIDAQSQWVKRGQFAWSDLAHLADAPPSLWANGDSSPYGRHDRMTAAVASHFRNSLYLIHPRDVILRVLTTRGDHDRARRRVRADFFYNGERYDFIVTDPATEEVCLGRPDGEYTIGAAFFCVSVTEEHTDGRCYKLVATVIPEKM